MMCPDLKTDLVATQSQQVTGAGVCSAVPLFQCVCSSLAPSHGATWHDGKDAAPPL